MNNLEEQIKQWVISADKYHYLLESEEDYIAKEITKLAIEFAREAYEQGITDCDCDTSLGRFEEWLDEQR